MRKTDARGREKTCASRSAQEALSTKEVTILSEPYPTQWPQEQGRTKSRRYKYIGFVSKDEKEKCMLTCEFKESRFQDFISIAKKL